MRVCIRRVAIQDHPRGCGENRTPRLLKTLCRGSPPRMRGKLAIAHYSQAVHGDHPRGCGENGAVCSDTKIDRGSPPRMRGKHTTTSVAQRADRITPADAGKTCYAVSKPPVAQDHPRGCGENYDRCCMLTESVGSPPRMRGKPESATAFVRMLRITPADAGKTNMKQVQTRIA